ncbi:MAG: hypothetical protein ABIS14_04765 [Sphingomonas sp.]
MNDDNWGALPSDRFSTRLGPEVDWRLFGRTGSKAGGASTHLGDTAIVAALSPASVGTL